MTFVPVFPAAAWGFVARWGVYSLLGFEGSVVMGAEAKEGCDGIESGCEIDLWDSGHCWDRRCSCEWA